MLAAGLTLSDHSPSSLSALQPFLCHTVLTIAPRPFAPAHAGLPLGGVKWISALTLPVTMGILSHGPFGKPFGIFGQAYRAFRLGKAQQKRGVVRPKIAGVGLPAGIGFTLSLFVTGGSLPRPRPAPPMPGWPSSRFPQLQALRATVSGDVFCRRIAGPSPGVGG